MLQFTEIVDKTGEVIGYEAKNGKYPFSIVRLKRGEGYVFSLYVTKKNDEWRVGQYDTLEKAVKAADKYNTKKDWYSLFVVRARRSGGWLQIEVGETLPSNLT